MTNQQPENKRLFFDVSKHFDGYEEEQMIWAMVENVLKRNNIEPKSGIKGLSVRYYDDGNIELQEKGVIDESWTTQSKSHIWDSITH